MIVQVREECNLLFDDYPTIVNEHQENEENSRLRKRDRQTERISSKRKSIITSFN